MGSDIALNFNTIFDMNDCKVKENYKWDMKVTGNINEFVKDKKIKYIAASPADHRSSYTGSGLPYQNQLQAFDNTPNIGIADLTYNNSFTIDLMYPNSYQIGLGSVLQGPTLYIQYHDVNQKEKILSICIGQPIPYRQLTYSDGQYTRARKDVTFYDTQFNLKPRSQEDILRSSAYPCDNNMNVDFWGSRPPL